MEGTRLSHYRIEALLGRGGMGEVYRAVDLNLDRAVALKFVAPELAGDPETLRRFEREARAAAALTHPHIAVLYAFDRSTDRPFIAMELMSGESLRDRLVRGPLPLAEALAIARDVAAGLALAHRRGIAHRDIKPENLMFDRDGAVKITDFGLARATQASRLTMTGSTLGTAAYMAPESVRASHAASGEAAASALAPGAPADVFALGVTLHESIAGGLPFAGDTPLALLYVIANQPPRPLAEACPGVPAEVAELVARMLEKDPEKRLDAATVARELAALTGAPPPVAEPTRPASPEAGTGGTSATAARTGALAIAGARTEELDVERMRAQVPVPAGEQGLEDPRAARRRRRGGRPMRWMMWMPIAVLGMLSGLWWGAGRSYFANRGLDRAVLLNNRGFQALQKGDLATARASCIAALRAAPHYGPAAINLAQALASSRPDSAVMLLTRVVREHPGDRSLQALANSGLGDIDAGDQLWSEAARHYGVAAAADPGNVTHLNNQANALIQAGRPDTARVVLDAAIRRDPTRAPLYKNMALAWARSGVVDSSLAWLDAGQRRDPGLASLWEVRAEVAMLRGDATGARASLDHFSALGGDSAVARGIAAKLRVDLAR